VNKPSAGNQEQIRAHLVTFLTQLIEQVFSARCPTAEFREAHKVLEALPLTTAEFATARNRLNNARTYLESGERGAALFELRLLRRSMNQ
jgi:hypothetical protein